MTRRSLPETLLAVAWAWAERSTCSRLHVGAVLARDGRAFAQGYNGPPRGMPHCSHTDGLPCTRAVHAEVNAIANAAYHGAVTAGSTLYVTHAPCLACAGVLVNAGVVEVVYARPFRSDEGLELFAEAGMPVRSPRLLSF